MNIWIHQFWRIFDRNLETYKAGVSERFGIWQTVASNCKGAYTLPFKEVFFGLIHRHGCVHAIISNGFSKMESLPTPL
jgi:hypothetical protein